MKRSRRHLGLILGAVLLMPLAAGIASAQESVTVSVSTTATAGTRQLRVTDVAGTTDLTELSLSSSAPTPFRVIVEDSNTLPTDGFEVTSTLNNLYLSDGAGGYTFGSFIPSSDVSVTYGTPITASGVNLDLGPDYLLSGSGIDCDAISALGVDLTGVTCTLPNLALDLLGAVTGGLTISGVPFEGMTIDDIDLSALDVGALPVALDGNQSGNYGVPDCSNGIGAGKCSASPAAGIRYMRGTGLTDISGLTGVLSDGLTSSPFVSADGTPAIATVDAIRTALLNSADGAVVDFGELLAQLGPGDQVTVLNSLFQDGSLSYALDPIAIDDLAGLFGSYNSYPRLSVDTTRAPVEGTYSGTLTVTLVD